MKRVPLHTEHEALGAHFVEFAGWEMPLYYSSIIEEHMAVRQRAGLFDVSHMGEIVFSGRNAARSLDMLSARKISDAKKGACIYTHLLDEKGHIIDDTIITRITEDQFLAVPNAATTSRVLSWCLEHASCDMVDVSDDVCCFALQGPQAARIMRALDAAAEQLRPFTSHITADDDLSRGLRKGALLVSRTGYTGEDGFEIFVNRTQAGIVWKRIMDAGSAYGLVPAGLGARDTLRLEKCYLLSGTDFDGRQTTLETGYDWIVSWEHDFIGREALIAQKEEGGYQKLFPFRVEGRLIPRHGDSVKADGAEGAVTSGGYSPVLRVPVAMGYLKPWPAEGERVHILSRGREAAGTVVKAPFVRRQG